MRLSRRQALVSMAGLLAAACSPAAPAPSATVATAGNSAASTTLSYWYVAEDKPLIDGVAKLAAGYQAAHPDVKLDVQVFPFAQYFQKLTTAWAAGSGPDVAWIDVTVVVPYAEQGAIVAVEDFMSDADKKDLDDFYPAPRGDMTYKGKVQTIALHQSTEDIIYHQDLLDAAGITAPPSFDNAWTWQQFLDAARKLTKRTGDTTDVWGFATHYSPSMYSAQPFVAQHGGSVQNADGTFSGALNSSASVEALTFYADLFRKEKVAPIERIPDMFQSKKVALYLANPFVLRDIQSRFPALKIGVTPMPKDVKNAVQSGAYHIGIPKTGKNPKLAWDVVKWFTSADGAKSWIESTGYMPARKSTRAALPWVSQAPWSIFIDGLEKAAVRRPQTLVYQIYDDTMTAGIKDMQLGKEVKPTLDEAVAKLDAELKKATR
jgi:ABC-type glycerol-3-phosphate transport system substrate-binding protein